MRRSLSDVNGTMIGDRAARNRRSSNRVRSLLLFCLAIALAPSAKAQSAETPAGSTPATAPGTAGPQPFSRFIPKENLLVYLEFSGLDAHDAGWKKTAAYQMLSATPLGAMLEDVSIQVLDKALSYRPATKAKGADIVRFLKHVVNHGFVMGATLNLDATADLAVSPVSGRRTTTFVLKGASTKEMRATASKVMGFVMGNQAKPRLDRKEGRTIVAVPNPKLTPAQKETAWAWWPEKDDLIICSELARVDLVLATVDAKSPNAAELPLTKELLSKEGAFEPVGGIYIDVAAVAASPEIGNEAENSFKNMIAPLSKGMGVKRIDLRWGFDQDALVTVARIIAPKPRQGFLALFEQPPFEKTALIPMPDGVESFLMLSLSPSQFLATISETFPAVRSHIEELEEAISAAGHIDVQKDLLSHLGPRMAVFVTPGKVSAATGDDSSEFGIFQNIQPAAIFSAIQASNNVPKLTIVAEVNDPEKFTPSLDAAMIAINNELKARAKEAAEEAQPADAENANPGPRGGRGGQFGGAQRGGTRRPKGTATPAPKFERMPGQIVNYVLKTPSDSTYRLGPQHFRPSVRVEGKFVAMSVSSEGAELAIKAAKNKDWKPSDDTKRAIEPLPDKLVLLGLLDTREIVPPLLSSLPGTLQTMINTAISVARTAQGNANAANRANPAMGGPGMRREGGPGGPGPGGPRDRERGGFRSQAPAPGSAADASMVQFNIDADKLPSAQELRSRLFPSSISFATTDQEIRIMARDAFPDLLWFTIIGMGMQIPAWQIARDLAPPPQAATGGQTPAAGGPGRMAPAGAMPPGMGGPGGPGGGSGRRGRRGD